MAAKTKESKANKEQVLQHEVWLELLYQLFSDQEIRKFAANLNLTIPGFSSKGITKAPIAILRKKTIERLKQHPNIHLFMQKLYDSLAEKYRDEKLSFEDFCQKIEVGTELSAADAVALAGMLYPAAFNASIGKIQHNLAQHQAPLTDISTRKITFKKELQLKAGMWEDASVYGRYIDYCSASSPDFAGVPPDTLKDWIREQKTMDPGVLAYMTAVWKNEWHKWTEGEKAVFLHLAVQDSMKMVLKVSEDADKEQEQKDKAAKATERKLAKLEKDASQAREAEKKQRELVRELESKLEQAEQSLQQSRKECLAAQACIKQYEEHMKESASAKAGSSILMIEEEDLLLVTRFDPADYENVLPADKVMTVRAPEDVRSMADAAGALSSGIRVLFIHSDGFSTKEQFELDAILKTIDIPYRHVSGAPINAARKIIYFLEGDLTNEVSA